MLNCVMFKGDFERVKFAPANGMELMAVGGVRVYAAQGRHQLYVQHLQPLGQGALELAFQQLRAKLEAEGLFAADRKRPVPRYPSRIVLVTSRQTAALQDMLKVLRRFPWVRLVLCHVPVQGEGCGPTMAKALAGINQQIDAVGGADLILLGRGRRVAGGPVRVQRRVAGPGHRRQPAAGRDRDRARGGRVDRRPGGRPPRPHADRGGDRGHGRVADGRRRPAGASGRLTRQLDADLRDARHRLAAVEQHEFFRRPTDRIDDLRQRLDDRGRSLLLAAHAVLRRRGTAVQAAADRLARQTPAARAARIAGHLQRTQQRLAAAVQATLRHGADAASSAAARLAGQHPRTALRLQTARLDAAADRLRRAAGHDLRRRADRVASLSANLEVLSPQRTLDRGYTVTRRAERRRRPVGRRRAGAGPDRDAVRRRRGDLDRGGRGPAETVLTERRLVHAPAGTVAFARTGRQSLAPSRHAVRGREGASDCRPVREHKATGPAGPCMRYAGLD